MRSKTWWKFHFRGKNCPKNKGEEWSLRAFASMPSTAIFLRANRAKVKFCEQLKILNGPFITPKNVSKNKAVRKNSVT